MKGGRYVRRKRENTVFRKLMRLADQRNNDAVLLAFLQDGDTEKIGGLELGALTEFKRHGNGGVEMKLVNKLAVLEKACALLAEEPGEELTAFLGAMGEGAADGGEGVALLAEAEDGAELVEDAGV